MTSSASRDRARLVLVLVGLGPRGTGLLERLVSNAVAGLGPGDRAVEVHLVDPFPAGGGRVWRDRQSDLLRLNTTTEDLTAFVDDSVVMAGPVTPGPTLYAWCRTHGADLDDAELATEAATLGPLDFPTRRLASAYFGFALDRVRRRAPEGFELVTHAQRAVDVMPVLGQHDGDVVVLENGERIVADAVVLLNSHVDVRPAPPYAALATFAEDHDLSYVPPGYGGDLDLSEVQAGTDVVVRGFGLGFVDLMVLLTEGRGGRFEPAGDGSLRYLRSGAEPHLLVGSRRGVPYHAKPMYRLQSAKQVGTTFCTSASISGLLRRGTAIEFWPDLWPLIGREVSWAYYAELSLGHLGRVTVPWPEFATRFAELPWASAALDEWIATVVPDPADRLDLLALDRPLPRPGQTDAADPAGAVSASVRAHVRADLARRRDVAFSADLAAFHALLAVLPVIAPALASPAMDPRSLVEDVNGWFLGFFSFFASGPPPDRLEQLLALEAAGVVSFLGGDLTVEPDDARGRFVACSTAFPDGFEASAMIEATLPSFDLGRTTDPLLSALARRGEAVARVLIGTDGRRYDTGQVRVDATHRLVRSDGSAAPRVFALGMHSMIKPAAFARPGSNGPVHRLNDRVARTLLALPPRTHHEATTTVAHQPHRYHHLDPIAASSGAGGHDRAY